MAIFEEVISAFEEKIMCITAEYCNSSDYCEGDNIRIIATNYCELLKSLLDGLGDNLLGIIKNLELENALIFAESNLLNGDYEACAGVCRTLIPRALVLYLLNNF